MKAGPRRRALKPHPKLVEDDESAKSGAVQSVDRAMLLLEALGEDEEGYRLTDLAIRTGLSPSTAHRLLTTLEKRRFVAFDQSDNMWHIGRQSFAIGSAFIRRRNFVAPALPFLRRLRDLTHETANLGIVDDGEVIVLTQVESREIMRAITKVGGRVPMVTSGIGKAILATYADEEVVAIIQRHGMKRLTPKSVVRAGELRDALETVRRDGYAFTVPPRPLRLHGMAVPIREKGSVLGCISMRFPRSAMSEEAAGARYGRPLAKMATAIAAAVAAKRGNG